MNYRRTKIVATFGPSTISKSMVEKMIATGINVARINMSHYSKDFDIHSLVKNIKTISKRLGKSVSIIMDLPGPKIRTSNEKNIDIKRGETYTLGLNADIPLNVQLKFKDIKKGAKVKVDDGKISFIVKDKISNSQILIRAKNKGSISPRKGVNISGLGINLPTLGKKDLEFIKLAIELDFDWIAMSFVRSPNDRLKADQLFRKLKYSIPIIAKIEKSEAIEQLDDIIKAFDGILIARGDLGLELELEKVPTLQKEIVKKCNAECTPVIVATQMLESMIHNPTPTRAEVSDVASAIYDGSDAIMLSGETAVGKFPLECVRMMKSIVLNIEKEILKSENFFSLVAFPDKTNPRNAICSSAFQMAKDLSLKVMIVMTESGSTGNTMSSFRPSASIFAMTPSDKVYRKLSLTWGVIPIKVRKFKSTDQMLGFSRNFLIDNNIIKKNDQFIMTAGIPVGITGTTNMIKIETI